MEKLDFITEDSKYATVRLLFGSKISSTLFAELIETVLVDFNNDEVRYFVDDVILATRFLGRMISLPQEVVQRLIHHNLTIDPNKMQECKCEIDFLGFKV